jgi:hypothetical protein
MTPNADYVRVERRPRDVDDLHAAANLMEFSSWPLELGETMVARANRIRDLASRIEQASAVDASSVHLSDQFYSDGSGPMLVECDDGCTHNDGSGAAANG